MPWRDLHAEVEELFKPDAPAFEPGLRARKRYPDTRSSQERLNRPGRREYARAWLSAWRKRNPDKVREYKRREYQRRKEALARRP